MISKSRHAMAIIAIILIAGGGGFYGGMTYQKSVGTKALTAGGSGGIDAAQFQNMTPEERQQFFQQNAGNASFRTGGTRGTASTGGMRPGNAGLTSGSVVKMDDTSMTVDLGQSGTKLILLSDKTSFTKPTEVQAKDLAVGDNVVVSGQINADGSIMADSVQVRLMPLRDNNLTPTQK
jgi:hypothetical protein